LQSQQNHGIIKTEKGIKTMGLLPMNIEVLPPCDDRVFKLILTAPEAKPALMNLVPAVIKRPITDIWVRNNELPPGDINEKAERLDLNCVTDDGSQVDIEMQSSRIEEKPLGEHKNLKGKSIFYLCDLHSSQNSKGKSYDELARSYQITFCGYTIFPTRKDFINSFSMRHDMDSELLSDAIHVMFVELSKLNEVLKKSVDEMTDLEKWAVFLRYAENPNYREVVNRVIESKEALNVAGELLMSISQDERERAIFRSRRMYQSDLESNMLTVRRVGHAEGRAEGHAEGETARSFVIARKMIADGEPLEKIMMYTDLTRAEVETLQDAN
jgi:predicted transposase/invertase (TIGR01784 family)